MKEQTKIPISKVRRATKFVTTGAKVGGNYLKHYAKKALQQDVTQDDLDAENANDIYEMLSELKGGALKAAQMLSMDQGILPKAFSDKFQLAQYNAPPLSYPLVAQTFVKYFGKKPTELFDTFSKSAVNAASIGQVHKATLDGKTLAVKVQYPGVASSMSNDLKIAAPMAARLMKVNLSDLDPYMKEVETRLLEETDYELELKRSINIGALCGSMDDLFFANYYPELSSKRIITMDWIDGVHLKEWVASNPSQDERNAIGQALWNFYNFQIHNLQKVHADPHPGNFLVTPENKLAIIDFGCVKDIPQDFYALYFQVIEPEVYNDRNKLVDIFMQLNLLLEKDDSEKKEFFTNILVNAIHLLGKPFQVKEFDFGNQDYFDEINSMMMGLVANKEVRRSGARGPQHAIYVNRVYFGLYALLNELKAVVRTGGSD